MGCVVSVSCSVPKRGFQGDLMRVLNAEQFLFFTLCTPFTVDATIIIIWNTFYLFLASFFASSASLSALPSCFSLALLLSFSHRFLFTSSLRPLSVCQSAALCCAVLCVCCVCVWGCVSVSEGSHHGPIQSGDVHDPGPPSSCSLNSLPPTSISKYRQPLVALPSKNIPADGSPLIHPPDLIFSPCKYPINVWLFIDPILPLQIQLNTHAFQFINWLGLSEAKLSLNLWR